MFVYTYKRSHKFSVVSSWLSVEFESRQKSLMKWRHYQIREKSGWQNASSIVVMHHAVVGVHVNDSIFKTCSTTTTINVYYVSRRDATAHMIRSHAVSTRFPCEFGWIVELRFDGHVQKQTYTENDYLLCAITAAYGRLAWFSRPKRGYDVFNICLFTEYGWYLLITGKYRRSCLLSIGLTVVLILYRLWKVHDQTEAIKRKWK